MNLELFGGGLLAFLCAGIAVGADAQTEARKRFGKLYGSSILSAWPGLVFIGAWGAVDLICYVLFINYHDWAKRAFSIDVEQNLLWMGIVVGLSAVLIIRTNLATVGTFQVGGELAYTTSRALLIEQLNRRRTRARRAFLTRYRPYCKDTTAYPAYFTSLEATLATLSVGHPEKAAIDAQLASIKSNVTAPATVDGSALAREGLTGLVYDYFGPAEADAWAHDSDYGNK